MRVLGGPEVETLLAKRAHVVAVQQLPQALLELPALLVIRGEFRRRRPLTFGRGVLLRNVKLDAVVCKGRRAVERRVAELALRRLSRLRGGDWGGGGLSCRGSKGERALRFVHEGRQGQRMADTGTVAGSARVRATRRRAE